jgi:hypothetical protein
VFRRHKVVRGISLGHPDTKPTAPAHVPGVRAGNSPGNYERSVGHLPDGRSTAARSTGINPDRRDPILPEMPNLSPP